MVNPKGCQEIDEKKGEIHLGQRQRLFQQAIEAGQDARQEQQLKAKPAEAHNGFIPARDGRRQVFGHFMIPIPYSSSIFLSL